MAEKLDAGDAFPQITLKLMGGGERVLPDEIETDHTVVLFYRGHW